MKVTFTIFYLNRYLYSFEYLLENNKFCNALNSQIIDNHNQTFCIIKDAL